MRWTRSKVREFVRDARLGGVTGGCKKCGKQSVSMELEGYPVLSDMVRDGSSIEEIQKAIEERGWFCRGCARKIFASWDKKQQQHCLVPEEPKAPEDKRLWTDERKFEYCFQGIGEGEPGSRARECWEEGTLLLDEALEILKNSTGL